MKTLERETPIANIEEAQKGKLVKSFYGDHRIYEVSRDEKGKVSKVIAVRIDKYEHNLSKMWEIQIEPGLFYYNFVVDPTSEKFTLYNEFLKGYKNIENEDSH